LPRAPSSARANNFDSLRAIAALMVLFSHSFPLSGHDAAEPIRRLSHGQTTAGTIAVAIFFIISGYLITMSFERSRAARTFVLSRALRLVPALAVVVLFLTFVAGPILSSDATSVYLRQPETYEFPFVAVTLVRFYDGLPGVFLHNPFPRSVDGSLWTLHYEVACYALVFLLGVSHILNKYVTTLLFLVGLVATGCAVGGHVAEFGTYFLAGAVIYHWQMPIRRDLAAVSVLVWVAALLWRGLTLASATFGAYLVIFLALSPSIRLPRLARWGDLSYGIYIWAFPVQQSIAWLRGGHITWYDDAALSLPIVLSLAMLSWHLIEAPALALKRRRAYAPTVAAERA
jgi:peptidoglycan/LPS O-acetylase OafA/YrhL